MKWPWSKKPLPEIPPFKMDFKAPQVKPEPGIVVDEVDTSQMTQTGVHKAWKRLTGQD